MHGDATPHLQCSHSPRCRVWSCTLDKRTDGNIWHIPKEMWTILHWTFLFWLISDWCLFKQYITFSLSILTFHFKPGSYFCQLHVLVVCFLVSVMSVIKNKTSYIVDTKFVRHRGKPFTHWPECDEVLLVGECDYTPTVLLRHWKKILEDIRYLCEQN